MHLLGWPSMNTVSVTERELRSLTGEAIHLGCMAVFLNSVFLDPCAPWWSGHQGCILPQPESRGQASSSTGSLGAPASALKRRRRIGPVKSLT